jgi:protoporphyrin/coproporphyrin ferrochelatase
MTAGPVPYDALLLLSFGGPEGPDDVIPFLENVTRGRGVPRERLVAVGEHYQRFGGVSPINAQCRELLAAIQQDFAAHGLPLPVYWGNRNWHPYLADTMRQMAADGVRNALVFTTSAYASYSGCRQYREDLARAQAEVGEGAPAVHKLRHYFNHPGFIGPMIRNTSHALDQLPAGVRADARLVFTTHSIPVAMAETSGPAGGAYVDQHLDAARQVAAGVVRRTGQRCAWDLVYQSRSGPPGQPWLEPDVCDHLEALHAQGVPAVVLVPIGFVSDHMEVRYDLDVQAAELAAKLGLALSRAATVGASPELVAAVRDLVMERMHGRPAGERPALGELGPSHDVCPPGCCPNLRGYLPAAAGED